MTLFLSNVSIVSLGWLKRFVLIFLPAAAVVSVAASTIMRLDERMRIERAEVSQNSRVTIARGLIGQDLASVTSDLRLLANLPMLKRYLDDGDPAILRELSRYFLVLAGEAGLYDQVRYLDARGQEVIRINYNGGTPVIVPRGQLQDKSGRYFFRDTIRLGAGEIYVSPLDLNIEHDQLEVPYKPMIRFGMPVFDRAGHKKGVILLNYFGSTLLRHFRDVMRGSNQHESMLLNRDGYWLSSDRVEDEWGFMLGRKERTFAHEFPDEWRAITAAEHGVIRTEQGLFVFATVHPLKPGESSSTGAAAPRKPSERELAAQEYYWKIVSFVPRATLNADFLYTQPSVRLSLAAIYLLVALGAGFTAYVMLAARQSKVHLRENETRLREITGTMNDGLLVMDQTGNISYGNPEACRLLGYSAEELLGADKHELLHVHPDGSPCVKSDCKILHVAQTGTALRGSEETFRRKDGMLLPVSVSAAAIARGPVLVGTVAAFHDISDLKEAEAALRRSAEEIEDLYDRAPCGYHSLDTDGLIVRINHTELEWLGYSRDEVVGKMHFADLLTATSQETFRESFRRFREHGYVRDLEFELERKDGSVFPVLLSATAVRDAEGRVVMSRATMFDLSERKKLERELQQQARTDALTGLNNRRYFLELAMIELERSRRYDEPLALLMLDVDYFKRINDTYGHHVGDAVLKQMSATCARMLREIDIAGRLGGEEFAIMLPETTVEHALEAAERLRVAISQTAVALEQGGTVVFTVSIGVTSHQAADTEVEAMLRRADIALYAAKRGGRNRVRVA